MSISPTTVERQTPEGLPELATRINKEHQELIAGTRYIVGRAIAIGDALNNAKAKVGHGGFLKWIKDNCQFSDKTAERYMKLAENKQKLAAMAQDKFETISNLTLNEVERLISEPSGDVNDDKKASNNKETENGERKTGGRKNTSDAYDALEEKLIEKLKGLEVEEAEAAVKETISKLNKTLKDIKQIADKAMAKAT